MRAHLPLSAVLLCLSCSPTASAPPCGPDTCATGCCSDQGECVTSTSRAACGIGGLRCQACEAGEACTLDGCRSPTGTGGGSATGGGGGTTGGGGGATGGGGGATGGGGGATGGGGGATGGGGGVAPTYPLDDSFAGDFCVSRYCWESPPLPPTAWTSLWFASENEGYAVHVEGLIARFRDGRWRQLAAGDGASLEAVWGMAGQAWAVGGNTYGPSSTPTIRRVVGDTVTSVAAPAGTRHLHGVFGFATNDVWFVGAGGTILRWDGTNLRLVPSGVTTQLRSVWGPSPNLVYAVGDNGVILRFNGTSWSLVPQPPGNGGGYFSSVHGTSATDLVVGGALAFHFDGTSWTALGPMPGAPPNNYGITTVRSRGPTDIWAATAGATTSALLNWTGQTWSVLDSGAVPWWGVAFQRPTTLWALREDGVWLRRTDTTLERYPTAQPTDHIKGVAGRGATRYAVSSNGVVRVREPSTGRWFIEDAGVSVPWSAACGTADGAVFASSTVGGQVYVFQPPSAAAVPWGDPAATDAGLSGLACSEGRVLAAVGSRGLRSRSTTDGGWNAVPLPTSFTFREPIGAVFPVPGTDQYLLTGSVEGPFYESFGYLALLDEADGTIASYLDDAGMVTRVRYGLQAIPVDGGVLWLGESGGGSAVLTWWNPAQPATVSLRDQGGLAPSAFGRGRDGTLVWLVESTVGESASGLPGIPVKGLPGSGWRLACEPQACWVFGPGGTILRRDF